MTIIKLPNIYREILIILKSLDFPATTLILLYCGISPRFAHHIFRYLCHKKNPAFSDGTFQKKNDLKRLAVNDGKS